MTSDPDITWSSSCGGSFQDGAFTPQSVNRDLPCTITATLTDEDGIVLCSGNLDVIVASDLFRDRHVLCGAGCGCTPGAAFGLLTFLGLVAMRFIGPRRLLRG